MYDYTREERINKERIRRLVLWYKGKKAGPIHIDAELHKRCNLNCPFCPRSASDHDLNIESREKELALDLWLSIVREAKEIGVEVFNLEGANEPIAVPELAFPVIEAVKEVGMYGILTTNGTLWEEEQLKKLVEIGWDRIHFSIDAPNARTHDRLRGRGTFAKIVKNIKLLNLWKGRLNSNRPMLNINIVIQKLNYFELPQFVEFCHKLNADYMFVEPLIVFSEGGRKLKLSDEEAEKRLPSFVKAAKELAEKYGIDNNFATQDENLRAELVECTSSMQKVLLGDVRPIKEEGTLLASPCFKPWTRIAIKFDGLTGHCGLIQEGENVEEKGLKEIWYGEWLENVRKRMVERELLAHCSHCIPSDVTQRRRFRRELMEALRCGHGSYPKEFASLG